MRTAGILAALAIVAGACSAIAPRPAPAVTPAITAFVVPTRSPAPSVSPTAFTGHYGFLVDSAAGYALTREGETTTLATIPLQNVAVSPDGRRVAGFTRSAPYELRTVDLASPATTARVAALAADELPGLVAWSVDGTGLVYSAVRADPGARGVPVWSALRTVDLANPSPKEIARIDQVALRPMVWDRLGGDLVGAFVVRGDIASEYVVVRGAAAPVRKVLPDAPWHPTVSGDGRWIVITAEGQSLYRTFQADDPSFVVETHGLTDAPVTAAGRPMSGEIGIVLDRQLILWDPATGLRDRVPSLDLQAIVGFRFDGSAAIVRDSGGLELLDIASSKTTPLIGAGVGVALP